MEKLDPSHELDVPEGLKPDHELPPPSGLDPKNELFSPQSLGSESESNSSYSHNSSSSHKIKLSWIIIGVILIIFGTLGAVGIASISKSSNVVVTPTPTPEELRPMPTPTPDPTAGWETYTNSTLGYSLKYPSTWYIETDQPHYLRIQNYKPVTMGTGYDPVQHAGKVSLQVRKWDKTATSLLELKALVEKDAEDRNAFNPSFIRNVKEVNINGIQGMFAEYSVTSDFSVYTVQYFFLKGDGEVIAIFEGMDVDSSKEVLSQIVSTFKFVNPTLTPSNSTTVCTQDAKLCPDGSYVGRVGPNCEFAPCP